MSYAYSYRKKAKQMLVYQASKWRRFTSIQEDPLTQLLSRMSMDYVQGWDDLSAIRLVGRVGAA